VLTDDGMSMTKAFGVREGNKAHPRPATYVLDADRKVLFAHVGASAGDRPRVDAVIEAISN
jgi:peroxiredoxin